MIEVADGLFVGSLQDCYNSSGFRIVHACKTPCHQKAVNYRGNLPPNHPNYLIYENGDSLFLNIVDMNISLSPKFADPIFHVALDFIENSKKPVLVHCNLGESRAPSIALAYLAKRKKTLSNLSYLDAVKEFREIYRNYNPSIGVRIYLDSNWNMIK